MPIDWEDRLGRQILRSLNERPEDWYVGSYEAYNPGINICIWCPTETGPGFIRIRNSYRLTIVDSDYGLKVKTPWRLGLHKKINEMRAGGHFQGQVGEGERSIFIC